MTRPLEILQGDVSERLDDIPDETVQCCVTSPPYWGLRDYGTATWEGGDAGCEHKPPNQPRTDRPRNGLTGGLEYMASQDASYKETCGKCNARRVDGQLGLEATPEEFIEKMVAVFREVRRVLRKDGTLWLNLGDSYASGEVGRHDVRPGAVIGNAVVGAGKFTDGPRRQQKRPPGLKPKDLVGIPWRVALALQADGWWLRQDIIWHKPNPMPESVTDRCTKAHEYLFLLTKSARYYYDAEAIAEATGRIGGASRAFGASKQVGTLRQDIGNTFVDTGTRNRRSVWTVPSAPYPEAHFATFPPALVEPCVLAGSKPGDLVLDPFLGSGTTAEVALKLGRRAIGIELNPEYVKLCHKRLDPILAQPDLVNLAIQQTEKENTQCTA